MVYENNGYWFEGEELGEGPLAADFTRRRIKMHQDVELVCGNFIWSGMFDALTVSQSADNPFLSDFSISFIAWKERFRTTSPYLDSVHNNVQRGHTYTATPPIQQQLPAPPLPPNVPSDQQVRSTQDTTASDQTPTFDIFNPSNSLSIFSQGNPTLQSLLKG
jgi:hypothetical protein